MQLSQLVLCIILALIVGHAFSQYDVSGRTTLGTDSTFYNQPVTTFVNSLSWQEGLNYITAATEFSVS